MNAPTAETNPSSGREPCRDRAVILYNDARLAHYAVDGWRFDRRRAPENVPEALEAIHVDSLCSDGRGNDPALLVGWMMLCLDPGTLLTGDQMDAIRSWVVRRVREQAVLVCLHRDRAAWRSSPVREFCRAVASLRSMDVTENGVNPDEGRPPSA